MDKDKSLALMRFWLFGTFVIVFAAATAYVGGVLGLGLAVLSNAMYWVAMAAAAVLCIIAYYIYKGILNRR